MEKFSPSEKVSFELNASHEERSKRDPQHLFDNKSLISGEERRLINFCCASKILATMTFVTEKGNKVFIWFDCSTCACTFTSRSLCLWYGNLSCLRCYVHSFDDRRKRFIVTNKKVLSSYVANLKRKYVCSRWKMPQQHIYERVAHLFTGNFSRFTA